MLLAYSQACNITNKITSNIVQTILCSDSKIPAGIYLLKFNNRNTRARCEKCSKLTINIPEQRHWRRSGIFIVKFEHISHLVCSIVNFKHAITGWVIYFLVAPILLISIYKTFLYHTHINHT